MDKLTPALEPAKRAKIPPAGGGGDAPALGSGADAEPLSPAAAPSASPLGVYVHFPYCLRKCPYCDFLSLPAEPESIPHERYADAVIAELQARRTGLGSARLGSVFFGGGTPSLWHPGALGRTLSAIVSAFEPDPAGVEISVECNPSSLNADRARALVDAGVNRFSIGVQGLDDERLRFLGRWHDAAQALASVRAALSSGVERVSADLIFGVAGQAPLAAADEARRLADLGLTHLSAYALTIEPQTQFGARARKGRLPLLSDDLVAESYCAVAEALGRSGFEHYEISNHARHGHQSRHNVGYWRGLDYLGLGCGAWGTLGEPSGQRTRYRNRPQPDAYVERALSLRGDPSPDARQLASESERLDPETQLTEALMLGLRLAEGVDVEAVARRSGAVAWTPERRRAVVELSERGQLERCGARLRIPREQWLLADGIIARVA